MSKYPTIDIIIPTYKRDLVLRKTVELLKINLIYRGDFHFIIGMDGKTSVDKMFAGHSDISVIPGPNKGLGVKSISCLPISETSLSGEKIN